MLRALESRHDKNHGHQTERNKAVRASCVELEKRNRCEIRAEEQSEKRNRPRPAPLVVGVTVPRDSREQRICKKTPERGRHAEERRPAAAKDDIAAGAFG